LTSLRMSAAINPASSETPTPIIATNTTATTLKLASPLGVGLAVESRRRQQVRGV
jgi:hypothetical protein